MHRKTLFFTLFAAFGWVVLLVGPPQSIAKTVEYTVKSGDCLWNISREMFKDPLKWPLIYAANEGSIRNPNLIYPGQRFAIPPPSAITKESLREATRAAYAKLAPIQGHRSRARPIPVTAERASPAASSQAPPGEVALASKDRQGSVETGPVAIVGEKSAPSEMDGKKRSALPVVLGVLMVLVGGYFLWRKMAPGAPVTQKPQPLSSFQAAEEPPSMTPVTPKPMEPQAQEPPMSSGTITSVSMPSTPSGTQAPVTPAAPVPGTPQAPTGSESASGSNDKPGDPPPPASTPHAA